MTSYFGPSSRIRRGGEPTGRSAVAADGRPPRRPVLLVNVGLLGARPRMEAEALVLCAHPRRLVGLAVRHVDDLLLPAAVHLGRRGVLELLGVDGESFEIVLQPADRVGISIVGAQ